MRYDLMKIHHWLLLSTFKNKWFEENIKHQIIQILSWFIYSDYRKQTSFLSLVKSNKLMIGFFSVILAWSLTFFTFGRLSSDTEVLVIERKRFINDFMKNIDFSNFKSERNYYEYLAYSQYKVDYFENLQKLPDDVFFTIISEIKRNKIPPSIFFRLLDQESHFLYIKNNRTGANGYGQVIPSTKKHILNSIGTTNCEKIDNIRISAYHLRNRYDFYRNRGRSNKESWLLSLSDYNGGCTSLAKCNMKYFTEELK